jgi:serine/threonine protein kinase
MQDSDHDSDIDAQLRAAAQTPGDTARVVDIVAARLFRGHSQQPKLGRYELLDVLGSGGMGTVYAAYDPVHDRKVAIKVVRDEPNEASAAPQARLVREARLATRLQHPNVVTVLEQGLHEGTVYVVMEFIDALPLDCWLSAEQRSWSDILEPFLGAAAGLAAAHAIGIVHRDFKPANVLLGVDGRARVVDFGLARPIVPPSGELEAPMDRSKSFEYSITGTGKVSGTPLYMAPELFDGSPATPKTDLYAFCISLLEAWNTASSRPPAKAIDVLLRGVAPQPDSRWSGMQELLDELTRAGRPDRRPRDRLRSLLRRGPPRTPRTDS